MRVTARGSLSGSLAGILVCGGVGGLTGWAIVASLGWTGAIAAIAAAATGMVVAVVLWTAGAALVHAIQKQR